MASQEFQSSVPEEEDEEYVSDGIEPARSRWKTVWEDNKGVFFILLAQIASSCMDAIARFMQQGEHSMHPFQVIVARMGTTWILSTLYMWYKQVPGFPLGEPSIRGWLLLRALFGFGGLYCLYYSVHYLPLAEALVLRFTIPNLTSWACFVFLGTSFTRKEFLAGLVALLGIIIIAHPAAIFGSNHEELNASKAGEVDDVSPTQRIIAICVAVLGVVGAAGAYTIIRVIGNRAHALLSVSYFALLSVVGSTIALLAIPGIGFTMPRGAYEWLLMLAMGILGFVLQFLLTAGLQLDRSSRATSVLYVQIIFALAFDWAIWGVLPDGWSLSGGAVVVASTLWSALQKTRAVEPKKEVVDEESALLGAQTRDSDDALTNRESTTRH